jgi:hypothetical protein
MPTHSYISIHSFVNDSRPYRSLSAPVGLSLSLVILPGALLVAIRRLFDRSCDGGSQIPINAAVAALKNVTLQGQSQQRNEALLKLAPEGGATNGSQVNTTAGAPSMLDGALQLPSDLIAQVVQASIVPGVFYSTVRDSARCTGTICRRAHVCTRRLP